MGRYRINGLWLDEIAGFIPDSSRVSSNSFEKPNDLKPVESYDWGDEHGVEYAPYTGLLRERVFTIQGHIVATSQADYLAKKSALQATLSGNLVLQAEEVGVTVNARFTKYSSWERLTAIVGSTKIVTKVGLEFDEVLTQVGENGKAMEYTLATYAAMLAIIPFEIAGVLYRYSIKHDEENGGGMPALYYRCDGDFIRFVPQEASL